MTRAKGSDKQSLLLQMGKVGEEVDSAVKKMRVMQVRLYCIVLYCIVLFWFISYNILLHIV